MLACRLAGRARRGSGRLRVRSRILHLQCIALNLCDSETLYFTYDTPDTWETSRGGPRRNRLRIRRSVLAENQGGISTKICGHHPRRATPRTKTRSPSGHDHSRGAFWTASDAFNRTCHTACPGSPSSLRRARHISSIASGERFTIKGTQAAIVNPVIAPQVNQGNAAPHALIAHNTTAQTRTAMPNRLIPHNRRYGAGKTRS